MIFTKRSEIADQHAFLSPSQYHWINYTEDKLADRYRRSLAVERGTKLHEFARDAILMNQRLSGAHNTVAMFVNDALGYKMEPELGLFYSWNCFGTADAVSYRRNYLRIHDLKTGEVEAHMDQLRIYAALFCLDYQHQTAQLRFEGKSDDFIAHKFDVSTKELHFDPEKMSGIELRIYQLGEVRVEEADPHEIKRLMDIIVADDLIINSVKAEG